MIAIKNPIVFLQPYAVYSKNIFEKSLEYSQVIYGKKITIVFVFTVDDHVGISRIE